MSFVKEYFPTLALAVGLLLIVLSGLNYFATLGNRTAIKQMAVDRARILRQMARDNPTLKIPQAPQN